MEIQFAANHFSTLEGASFSAADYSKLKFGSDAIARQFGYQLADAFAAAHMDVLLANKAVVIPSPYNHVSNAATILTHHFVNRLNQILVGKNGSHVEYSVIHRKVSYINDYGFLDKEARKGLIDNDSFYLNKDFYKGKLLIFVDDVIITGTHEDKLKEILVAEGIDNDTAFIYFAQYHGSDATIESRLNFTGMSSLNDYAELSEEDGHHIIVRPLKFLLIQEIKELAQFLSKIAFAKLEEIYNGCLGEGYYTIPSYQAQFQIVKGIYEKRNKSL